MLSFLLDQLNPLLLDCILIRLRSAERLIRHIPQLFLEVASISLIIQQTRFVSAGADSTVNVNQTLAQRLFLLMRARERMTDWMPEGETEVGTFPS